MPHWAPSSCSLHFWPVGSSCRPAFIFVSISSISACTEGSLIAKNSLAHAPPGTGAARNGKESPGLVGRGQVYQDLRGMRWQIEVLEWLRSSSASACGYSVMIRAAPLQVGASMVCRPHKTRQGSGSREKLRQVAQLLRHQLDDVREDGDRWRT